MRDCLFIIFFFDIDFGFYCSFLFFLCFVVLRVIEVFVGGEALVLILIGLGFADLCGFVEYFMILFLEGFVFVDDVDEFVVLLFGLALLGGRLS